MTCWFIRDNSMSQPFSNLAMDAYERFERYQGNDVSSTLHHPRAESMEKPVAIKYLGGHAIYDKWFCTSMFATCYHGYMVLNRLASYTIQDLTLHCRCHEQVDIVGGSRVRRRRHWLLCPWPGLRHGCGRRGAR